MIMDGHLKWQGKPGIALITEIKEVKLNFKSMENVHHAAAELFVQFLGRVDRHSIDKRLGASVHCPQDAEIGIGKAKVVTAGWQR